MSDPKSIIEIADGKLQGCSTTNLFGDKYFKFLGIPYAKSPEGELRFQAPQPPEPWSGIRDATKQGNIVPQIDMMQRTYAGDEKECLNVNVFTRKVPTSSDTLKPTLVYIHGGAFTVGSNDAAWMANPDFFMIEDVVLVAINYRLGVLGFLSSADPELNLPGNNGLKDQVAALKWVQRNIHHFGGDPNNVTIFGISAGSASVDYLLLSPTSKGLFHKAILQSGVAINCWAWGKQGNAIDLVEALGKTVENEKEALDVLKNLSAKEILNAASKIDDKLLATPQRPFSPVIEYPNESAFLTKQPIEILTNGEFHKVPVIYGYTDKEGRLLEFVRAQNDLPKDVDFVAISIPWYFDLKEGSVEYKELYKELEKLYNGFKDNDDIFDAYTDSMFLGGIIESVKKQLQNGNESVFLYRFGVESKLNLMKNVMPVLKPYRGASHGDDMGYFFKSENNPPPEVGSFEEACVKKLIKLWTNFAAYGNPTPSAELLSGVVWKPVSNEDDLEYLDMKDEFIMRHNPDSQRVEAWSKILKKYPPIWKS